MNLYGIQYDNGQYDSVAEPVNEEINAFQTNNNRFNNI